MAYPKFTGEQILEMFGGALNRDGISIEAGAGEFIALAFSSMLSEQHQLWRTSRGEVEEWLRSTYDDLPFHLLFAAGHPELVPERERIRLNEKGFKPVAPRLRKIGFFEAQHYVERNIVAFNPFPRNAG